jgi:hypothetical protein
VLKHCVYIWHGCGMHSKRVWSLNHDITTSLGLGLSSIFLNSTPGLDVTVYGYTHMPIHSISWCWNTVYTYDMDVGNNLCGFVASTMTLQTSGGGVAGIFNRIIAFILYLIVILKMSQ